MYHSISKSWQLSIILFAMSIFSFAQDEFRFDHIPKELLKNAEAVLRNYTVTYEVNSVDEIIESKKYIITILNQKGDNFSSISEDYDKFKEIKSFNVTIYNQFGKKLFKVKKSEIVDISQISGYSIFDDNRVKKVNIVKNTYPYTIEVSVEAMHKGMLSFPMFYPHFSNDLAIQHAEYNVIVPEGFKINYKKLNFDFEENITTNSSGKEHYQWVISNYKARNNEPYSPVGLLTDPIIFISPVQFNYDKTSGDLSTWKSYGKWINGLLENQDNISLSTKIEIDQLIAGVNDTYEKVRLIYEYMQKKTRYVSIQLGIGGFQPFPANTVDELGYGDCKALSNYTHALLKSAGIDSYYTEIGAGSRGKLFFDEFANAYLTNHVILCVPNENDTIWLECTSSYKPAGFIGGSDENRNVILMTENGGVVAKTKKYEGFENTQKRIGKINISEIGDIDCEFETSYKGLQYDDNYFIVFQSFKEQSDKISEWLPLANFNNLKFTFENIKSRNPELIETISFNSRNYASQVGDRLMFNLNMLNKRSYVPENIVNRENDVALNYPYEDLDSLVYIIPSNYNIEFCPDEIIHESEFGHYSMKTIINEDEIIYIRKVKMNEGIYPKEKYSDLREFFKKINKADNVKLVLNKKNQ